MTEPSRSVHWERLAVLRSPLLLLIGMVLLCVAAFMWDIRAGLAAAGLGVILIGYLTDGAAPSAEMRR